MADARNSLYLIQRNAAGFQATRYKPKSAADPTDSAAWVDIQDPVGTSGTPGRFALASISQEVYVVYEEGTGLKVTGYR